MAALDDGGPVGDDPEFDNLTVDVTVEDGDIPVVRVAGEIDVATADSVRAAIAAAMDHRPTRLVIDMESVSFMDSSGIAVLLEAAQQADSVVIRRPSNAVRRVIETTGLSEVLPIGE